MDNIFSFKRIGLILRADWIEHKRTFCLTAALLLVGYIILLLWKENESSQFAIYLLGLFLGLVSYFSFVGRKIHRSKGLSLTLPASTLEKYISLLIMGVCYFLLFTGLFWIVAGLFHLFTGMKIISLSGLADNPQISSAFFTFMTAYLLVCYFTFRKYPAAIGLVILIVLGTLFGNLYGYIYGINFISGNYDFVKSDAIYETMKFLGENFHLATFVTSAVLFYVAYLKLKEKEIK